MPTVDVNGFAQHYFDDGPDAAGDADGAIVMVHGFARNGTIWDGWLPRLTPRFRVIRPDIRGCGRNPDPGPDFVFDIDVVVADLIELLDRLDVDAVHYVGESTGGIAGALAAARHGERFRSLTLVSTPITTVNSDRAVKSPGADTPEESLRRLGLKEWWLQSRALTGDLFGDERDVAIADEFARTPVHVAVSMWEQMHKPHVNLREHLPRIAAPTLVLSPGASFTMSADDQEALIGAIPDARYRVYDGAPHAMYLLRADELATEMVEFIDSL